MDKVLKVFREECLKGRDQWWMERGKFNTIVMILRRLFWDLEKGTGAGLQPRANAGQIKHRLVLPCEGYTEQGLHQVPVCDTVAQKRRHTWQCGMCWDSQYLSALFYSGVDSWFRLTWP